jgi:hypothetical protein
MEDEKHAELRALALRFHALFLELKDPDVAKKLSSTLHAIAPATDTFASVLAESFFGEEILAHLHFSVYSVPTVGAQLGFLPRLYTREDMLFTLFATLEYVKNLPPQFFALSPQPSVN